MMKLRDAVSLLNGKAYCPDERQLDIEIRRARACDVMSEVLAADAAPDILLTGLCNAQVIRTASVFGIKAVIIVRGKAVNAGMEQAAKEEGVVLITTKESLFTSCGKLYAAGVRGVHEGC